MLTGERRFPSARRGGGMTVLGKVTVPKPINLPSQRLENNGLDPNVEIVPKGTLNWGTRSSSAQNAWASPAQSPPKTGGSGSPGYLSGRPSSGGDGTRPSTAGSDRSHDPVPNVWGPSSRPSSASGVLTSNQTSVASARPRSAEPRPASSQLSRFAEPLSENPVTWGAPGTMEKLGTSSSRSKDFSLSSGDFPTLGSEKATESILREGHSSQGRPVSASGRAATPEQRLDASSGEDSINTMKEKGAVNTLKNANILEVEAGDQHCVDKWQWENKSQSNQNMPQQQFGPWHGTPPHNPPNGVWYRGPFGGLPYGPPGPPGSYPHEPFAYYHPGLPARPAGNLQPVLPPGSAPSGYFPDKGDSHQPHMPDSYMQPVMPFGPGPYPVQVSYDGYYGPPQVGSYISNERRPPVMGMTTAPCVYNRYPIQNPHPDPDKFHGSSGYVPSTRTKEHGGSGHLHGTRQGPYKVLLKHHDGGDENDCKEEQEHTVIIPCLERENLPGPLTRESCRGVDRRHDEQVSFSKTLSVTTSAQYADSHGGHSAVPVYLDAHEIGSKDNRIDDSLVQKPERQPIPGEDSQKFMPTKRNPTLFQKIERLNNKARMKDGQYDEKLKALRALNSKADETSNESGGGIESKAPTSGILSPPTFDTGPNEDKRVQVLAFTGPDTSRPANDPHASVDSMSSSSGGGGMIHHNTQKRSYGVQGRTDNRSKGRSYLPKDEEWRKKPFVADSSTEAHKDEACDDNVQDQHAALQASDKMYLNQGKVVEDECASDPSDHHTQRAKMREIVAERAKRLQQEEEERTREQKARALAKLEELNRRTLAEMPNEKMGHVLTEHGPPQHKQENSEFDTVATTNLNTSTEVRCSASGWDCDIFAPSSDYDIHGHEVSTDLPEKGPLEVTICSQQDPMITNKSYLPSSSKFDTKSSGEHAFKQGRDTTVPKQKQVGYRRKQQKNSTDKVLSCGESSDLKRHANVLGDVHSLSSEPNPHCKSNLTDDSLLRDKKKNNASGKNKSKLDDVSCGTTSLKLVPIGDNSVKPSTEVNKRKTSVSVFEVGSVQVPFSIEIAESQDSGVLGTDQGLSQSTEDVHTGVNNELKHHPRRMAKSTHSTKATQKLHVGDSVVWAPVGSLKKHDDSDDAALNGTLEIHTSSVIGRGTQSNHKGRRAEMERYVPKPVAKEAKELSVQVITEQPLASSVIQGASDESTVRSESTFLSKEIGGSDGLSAGKGGLPVVSRNGESKHSKHGKTHGLWRPRTIFESTVVQPSLEEACCSLGPSKTVNKSFEQRQTQKVESYVPKEQAKYPNNLNVSSFSTSKEVSEPIMKDHGVANRGKRHSSKVNKTSGNIQSNSDHNDLHGRVILEAVSQSFSLESTKLDGQVASGEKHAIDALGPSHWQPKSQSNIAHDRQGSSRAHGGQNVSSRGGRAPNKEYPTQDGEHLASRTDKNYKQSLLQPHSDMTEHKIAVVHHQEIKRERRGVDSPKQSPLSSDNHPADLAKLKFSPENVNNEQSFSGLRRHTHQNHFGRAHEVPRGTPNPGVQENSKQLPRNSDKQRHDSHNEFQRARSNCNESIESFEDGSRVTRSRYGERGQTHSRRGGSNSSTRNSGTVRVPARSRNREQNPECVTSPF